NSGVGVHYQDGNSLLRILKQSVSSSSGRLSITSYSDPRTARIQVEEFDESDQSRVKDLEEKVPLLNAFLEELEGKIQSFSNKVGSSTKEETKQKEDRAALHEEEYRKVSKEIQDEDAKSLTGYNILLLYADDWSHHTLSSFHKNATTKPILQTPMLDALAEDGIRFTHNCVTTSVCWVSRATLFTGQYMSRHNTTEPCCWSGMEKPRGGMKDAPSNWKELSVYELLAKHGYYVGHAGKWGVYMPWPKNVAFSREEDGWHYRQMGDKVWHITEKNEADALRFLVTRPRHRPFFLNVAFYATHALDHDSRQYLPQNKSMSMYVDDVVPIPATGTDEAWKKMPYFFDEKNEGRQRWRKRFQNNMLHQSMMKNYYRMASEVDSACGAILEELRRQDALDNTFIIFTTDNGNFHSEHGLADKWYPHEESIRVPLIIRDPRMKEETRGTTNDAFTLNVDLAPTILGAAGIPSPEMFMGRDISQLYLTRSAYHTWRKEFFYEHPPSKPDPHTIPASEALVRKDYKYMYWPNYDYEQLFDLVKDPGELDDIFNSTDPDVVSVRNEMKKRFTELKKLVKSNERVTL
ncbi:hypothetical protein HJC23_008032, partial [Cyclotella cryptica]